LSKFLTSFIKIKDLNVILKDSFRPVSTWSKDGWLSIYDINNVM